MIDKLCIENIAVIDRAEVDFDQGMTVLTGETGSGKSILIGSINLLLGQRVSKDIVRQGADSARVTASFSKLNPQTLKFLETNGFSSEDEELIVSREVTLDGKSSARINGHLCTAAALKELGSHLVDIHGQHDSHFLLSPENHVQFLDEFAHCEQELANYQSSYHQALKLKKELQRLQASYQELLIKKDLLSFQVEEIDQAHLRVGEDEELEKRRAVLKNFARISENIRLVYQNLFGEENAALGVNDIVGQSTELLRAIAPFSPQLKELYDKLFDVEENVRDLTLELDHFLETFEYHEEELEAIEERLNQLYGMRRKYIMSLAEILEFRDSVAQELAIVETNNDHILDIKQQLSALQNELHERAKKLYQKRCECADRLDEEIAKQLSFLEMPKVIFKTEIISTLHSEKTVYTVNGCDKVEFLISTNLGDPPKPLVKIASGGELSRIMLALKSVLKSRLDTDTLIFDEIDTGVSGKAAQKIGMKMREIARNKQVICVTHLSQIAALAQNHILISKNTRDSRAVTSLAKLDFEGRKREIARIISGIDISDSALRTAEELLRED